MVVADLGEPETIEDTLLFCATALALCDRLGLRADIVAGPGPRLPVCRRVWVLHRRCNIGDIDRQLCLALAAAVGRLFALFALLAVGVGGDRLHERPAGLHAVDAPKFLKTAEAAVELPD